MQKLLEEFDIILLGIGSGFSTAAGYEYSGESVKEDFKAFIEKFKTDNIYEMGFMPFEDEAEYWGYFSKLIYKNRYTPPKRDTYKNLAELFKKKEYFILTTNVDHALFLDGLDEEKIFEYQGDFGKDQCGIPCTKKLYDNRESILKMIENIENTKVPEDLIPVCPICGNYMMPNIRVDERFVEDENWHRKNKMLEEFVEKNKNKKVLLLEMGVGYNTPGIIKYRFWKYAKENPNFHYAVVNKEKSYIPEIIKHKSYEFVGDIDEIIRLYFF